MLGKPPLLLCVADVAEVLLRLLPLVMSGTVLS
jgi:hypothetical protein